VRSSGCCSTSSGCAGGSTRSARSCAPRASAPALAEAKFQSAEAHARESLAETRRRLTTESDAVLARARELWQTVHREARRAEKRRDTSDKIREEIGGLERRRDELVAEGDRAAAERGAIPPPAPLSLDVGARVRVRDLGVEAEVVSGPDAEGRVQLRRGAWSIQSHVSQLVPRAAPSPPRRAASPRSRAAARRGICPTRRRRSKSICGAWTSTRRCERSMRGSIAPSCRGSARFASSMASAAACSGPPSSVICASHPQVASQRMGALGEGGRGVTVARLR
jgi:hypothetical protein